MNAKDTNTYATDVRTQATNLLVTIQKLQALKEKWDALDLGTTLDETLIAGDNEGITKAQLGSVVYDTLLAFQTDLAAGHATNLHTIAIL